MLNMKNDETFEVSFLLATESFYRNSGKRLNPCLHLRLGFALWNFSLADVNIFIILVPEWNFPVTHSVLVKS